MTFQTLLGLALFAGLFAWVAYVLHDDSKRPPRYPDDGEQL